MTERGDGTGCQCRQRRSHNTPHRCWKCGESPDVTVDSSLYGVNYSRKVSTEQPEPKRHEKKAINKRVRLPDWL